jgi:hypothetical protein
MWFASCSVWQIAEVTETDCQNFEGNSQVLSGQLFAIQHFGPSLKGNVHSDGSYTSLSFKHLLFPLQVHETKFLEKLTGARKVKKFPTIYGTRMFVTIFTQACHVSLSWMWWVKFTSFHPISLWCILFLFSRVFLGFPGGLSPYGFPTKILFPLPFWGSASFSRTLLDGVGEWMSNLLV